MFYSWRGGVLLCVQFFCSILWHSRKVHKEERLLRPPHVSDTAKRKKKKIKKIKPFLMLWGQVQLLYHSSNSAGAALRCITHCLLLLLWVGSVLALPAPSWAALPSHPPVHSEHLLIRFIYSISEDSELLAKGNSKYAHAPTVARPLRARLLSSTTPLYVSTSSHLADTTHNRQLMGWHGGNEGCCSASQTKPYGTFAMACRGW